MLSYQEGALYKIKRATLGGRPVRYLYVTSVSDRMVLVVRRGHNGETDVVPAVLRCDLPHDCIRVTLPPLEYGIQGPLPARTGLSFAEGRMTARYGRAYLGCLLDEMDGTLLSWSRLPSLGMDLAGIARRRRWATAAEGWSCSV